MTLKFLTFLCIGLLLFGCTSNTPPVNPDSGTDVPSAAPVSPLKNPSFTITSPASGRVFDIADQKVTSVDVALNTQNLVLKTPGSPLKVGEGYFKFTLDDDRVFVVSSKSYSIPDVPIGEHTLRIELLKSDGSAYSGIVRGVRFSVISSSMGKPIPVTYVVNINDNGFDPSLLNLNSGDRITFINTITAPQSVISSSSGIELFNTHILTSGQNSTVSIDRSGEFEFFSTTRPLIKGKIIVKPTQN
ncbi:cupredoxin domain-containing protein [Candidatus Micrarchaeota archaeon]|nr:cupredoxin domain-containing protein [Candidatus Micrarchaeota archaeon]